MPASIRGFAVASLLAVLAACSGEEPAPAAAPAPAAPAAHTHAVPHGDIGSMDFQVSCAPEVRAEFDHALGMMHHMMYDQAREGFRQIATRDPACAMAYWGEATTLFQPLWPTRPGPEDLARGWELIQEARASGTASERDARLIAATEAFFREPDKAEWWTRIGRWAEALEAAYKAHPGDTDVAALYALSRLALAYTAKDRAPLHAEASRILLEIWKRAPTHPGAVHYTIHTNDAEGRAAESLEVVGSYSEIAPNVPHALHMPTHIYVRLGRWPEVIEWNEKSAAAALQFPVAGTVSSHYIHAADYKLYAQLQRGEDAAARKTLEAAMAMGRHQPYFTSAFHLAAMPARLALERREWAEAAALTPRTPADQPWDKSVWAEGLSWFARGIGAARSGDAQKAAESERKLAELRGKAETAGEKGFATFIEVDRRILAGWMAQVAKQPGEAEKLLRSAAELEGTVEKHPVTPGAVYPPYEALGDLLMAQGRPADAQAAYESAEKRWPGRFNTLLGAARAAKAAGQGEAAARHYAALLKIVGESAREGVAEAKQFMAARPA